MGFSWIQPLDEAILLFFQETVRSGILTKLLIFFTRLGDSGLLWVILAACLLVIPKTRQAGLLVAISLAVTTLLCNLALKPLVARARPFSAMPELDLLIPPLWDFSFPSGHASASFAAATALTLSCGKKGAWAFLPASLIAFSRVYLGVHYPSDVAAGALLGTGVAFACRSLLLRRKQPRRNAGKKDH